ncbi:MAG: zinc-dependent metalloprotease [Chitinophagaceae bacterium]|jgi:hypothetical protein
MKKLVCLLASAFILTGQARAQSCGTDNLYNKLKADHPEIKDVELKLNAAIYDAIEKQKADLGKYGKTTATVLDIPLVIHIVHDYGAENVTDDAIFDAVEYWNVVFNAQNADTSEVILPFKKYIGNAQINFHLATKDPSGNPTKGITRRQSYLSAMAGDEAKLDDWPNNKYINIWFVSKFDESHSGAAAYAYYPSSGASYPHYDGVIGLAAYLNTDKTIPHELGHVLNLKHLWGDSNNPGVACGDDLVDDTPPTMGHSSCSPADLFDKTCSIGYTKGSINYPDTNNTQNIMEYAFCSRMFTLGQVARMRAALSSGVAGRNNLYSVANLVSTGALEPRPDLQAIPDFSVEKGLIGGLYPVAERSYFLCENSTTNFVFRNRSWNDTITNSTWTFSNSPATATSTALTGNVLNTFGKDGWVTITLESKGNNTAPKTISRQAVYVASKIAKPLGYANYFSTLPDADNWPMFNYYNNNFKWEYSTGNGYPVGTGCVRYHSYDSRPEPEVFSGKAQGDYDDMFTPAFDLASAGGNLNLNFNTAGCNTFASDGNDSMQIFASTTCGNSWVRIATLGFSDLMNNSVRDPEFTPSSPSDWKGQTIHIPAEQRSDRTFFRFRYWPSKGGNNLYFDNFTISPWTTDIKEVAQNATEIKLFPNPTSGNTKLCFTTGANGDADYIIRDVTGKVIAQKSMHFQPNTFVQEDIDRSQFPATGIYLITLTNSDRTKTEKLLVQ